MKLIVGLGNPGSKYINTRHNVGFMAIDAINSRKFINSKNIILVKPQTFMNESGRGVVKAVNFYKISLDDLYVIHDDLDLKLGEYKIQKGIGPKLHYGITSIEDALKSKDFYRVRVGVDNRESTNRISGEEYVLQNFLPKERKIIENTIKKLLIDLISNE